MPLQQPAVKLMKTLLTISVVDHEKMHMGGCGSWEEPQEPLGPKICWFRIMLKKHVFELKVVVISDIATSRWSCSPWLFHGLREMARMHCPSERAPLWCVLQPPSACAHVPILILIFTSQNLQKYRSFSVLVYTSRLYLHFYESKPPKVDTASKSIDLSVFDL